MVLMRRKNVLVPTTTTSRLETSLLQACDEATLCYERVEEAIHDSANVEHRLNAPSFTIDTLIVAG